MFKEGDVIRRITTANSAQVLGFTTTVKKVHRNTFWFDDEFDMEVSSESYSHWRLVSTEKGNKEQVKHPAHHFCFPNKESIKLMYHTMTKEEFRGFCFGNVLKYRLRAGKKDEATQDIAKATQYEELWNKYYGET